MAIANTGSCYTWGSAKFGQLGHGTSNSSSSSRSGDEEEMDELLPRLIESLQGKRVVAASCGWLHTALLVSEEINNQTIISAPTSSPALGYFEGFANEILFFTLSYLDARSLARLGVVNSTFRLITEGLVCSEILHLIFFISFSTHSNIILMA